MSDGPLFRSLCALLLTLLISACGSSTGLDPWERDASSVPDARLGDDAGRADVFLRPDARPDVSPPECGGSGTIGQIRAQVSDIDSRVAVGRDGMLFTARQEGAAWFALGLDPCLEERWIQPLRGDGRPAEVDVSVSDSGDVWWAADSVRGEWHFSHDGEPLQGLPPMDQRRGTFVGLADGTGPIFSASFASDDWWLVRNVGGRREELSLPSSPFVWKDECVILGQGIACYQIAIDESPLSIRWEQTTSPRIVDGTLRHIVPPATDGRRLWTIEWGIFTYDLVGVDLETGERVIRVPFLRTSNQNDLLLGPPVITERGDIIVYRRASIVPGALVSYTPEGVVRWEVPFMPSSDERPGRPVSTNVATHLVGAGGIVYLAMGSAVVALDEEDGGELWRLDGLGNVNQGALNLSPNGDLYVRNAGGTLYAITTGSAGLASTPWPIPGGNARLSRAR
ncbi:MAG: hypothetical protein AB8H86_18795 [Polyangiales bacterium]